MSYFIIILNVPEHPDDYLMSNKTTLLYPQHPVQNQFRKSLFIYYNWSSQESSAGAPHLALTVLTTKSPRSSICILSIW